MSDPDRSPWKVPKSGTGQRPQAPQTGGEGGGGRGSGFIRIFLYFAAGIALTLLMIWLLFPDAWESVPTQALVGRVAVLATIGALLTSGLRTSVPRALKMIGIWVAIVAVLAVGYSFRHEMGALGGRVVGQFVPSRGFETAAGELVYERSMDGHFYVDAQVNGTPVRFMVDTGATLVVLDRPTAARVGFDVDRLDFGTMMRTANGDAGMARVTLERLAMGPLSLEGVPAGVSEREIGLNLLGMSVLRHLSEVRVEGDRLVLRP